MISSTSQRKNALLLDWVDKAWDPLAASSLTVGQDQNRPPSLHELPSHFCMQAECHQSSAEHPHEEDEEAVVQEGGSDLAANLMGGGQDGLRVILDKEGHCQRCFMLQNIKGGEGESE